MTYVKIWLGSKEVKSFCELEIRLFTYVVASGRTNLISHGRSCSRDWVLDADFEVIMFWIFITKLFKTCIWLLSCQKYWTEASEVNRNGHPSIQAKSAGLEFLERFWSQEVDVDLPMISYMRGLIFKLFIGRGDQNLTHEDCFSWHDTNDQQS